MFFDGGDALVSVQKEYKNKAVVKEVRYTDEPCPKCSKGHLVYWRRDC